MNKGFIVALPFLLLGCSLLQPSMQKTFENSVENAPYDAIIVPGVPYNGSGWSTTMKMRVHWSKYLYERNIAKNIIYSGGAVYTNYYECKVMRLYALGLGIPDSVIFLDTIAEHSLENLYYGYLESKNYNFSKIALATDIFQAKNVRKFINKHELPISIIPAVFDSLMTLDRFEPAINPESAISSMFISIEDRENLIQRLKGTLGQQINWNIEDVRKKKFQNRFRRQGRLIE